MDQCILLLQHLSVNMQRRAPLKCSALEDDQPIYLDEFNVGASSI